MKLRSPWRYPGGKDKMAKTILSCFRGVNFSTLVEPFAGGASVSVQSNAKNLVINDLDFGVYDFWKRVVGPEKEYQELVSGILAYDKFLGNQAVEEYRKLKSSDRTGIVAFVINRWSTSGLGNGPIGGWQQLGKYNIKCRYNVKRLLKKIADFRERYYGNCQVLNTDFSEVPVLNGSVLYVDPPYVVWGRDGGLYGHGMTIKDHQRLAEWMKKQTCPFVVSYDSRRYDDNSKIDDVLDLWSGCHISEISTIYTIGTSRKKNERVSEILILGNGALPPSNRLTQIPLSVK